MFKSVKYLDGEQEETDEITRPGKVFAEFQNGDTFEGEYEQSNKGFTRTGKGVYTWTSKAKYEGDYRDGKRHGQGVYLFASGDTYEGGWLDGVKSGKGKYIYTTGDEFIGQWTGDKRNGEGTFINSRDKLKLTAIWKNGHPQEDTVKKFPLDEEPKPEEPAQEDDETPKADEIEEKEEEKVPETSSNSGHDDSPATSNVEAAAGGLEQKTARSAKNETPAAEEKNIEETPATPGSEHAETPSINADEPTKDSGGPDTNSGPDADDTPDKKSVGSSPDANEGENPETVEKESPNSKEASIPGVNEEINTERDENPDSKSVEGDIVSARKEDSAGDDQVAAPSADEIKEEATAEEGVPPNTFKRTEGEDDAPKVEKADSEGSKQHEAEGKEGKSAVDEDIKQLDEHEDKAEEDSSTKVDEKPPPKQD